MKTHRALPAPSVIEPELSYAIVAAFYRVPVFFEGQQIGSHRLDLLVEERVIVEVKSAEVVVPAFKRQLRSYLGISRLKLGILLHFGSKAQFYRVIGPERPGLDSSQFVTFASAVPPAVRETRPTGGE